MYYTPLALDPPHAQLLPIPLLIKTDFFLFVILCVSSFKRGEHFPRLWREGEERPMPLQYY